mgnify:CR=1 FL=1
MKMKNVAKDFSLCIVGFIGGSIATSIGVIHLVKKSTNIQNGISLEIEGWIKQFLHKGENGITGRSHPDVVFKTREEADEVLSTMKDLLDKYGVVTVSDFCELSSIPSTYIQNKYGWVNIDAYIAPIPDGYTIVFKNYPKEVF